MPEVQGLPGLKGCLLSEVFTETRGDASEHQWLMSETKFNVDQTQMCAQPCVRWGTACENAEVIPEPEQCLLGQRDLKYFESFEQAEKGFVSHIRDVFISWTRISLDFLSYGIAAL